MLKYLLHEKTIKYTFIAFWVFYAFCFISSTISTMQYNKDKKAALEAGAGYYHPKTGEFTFGVLENEDN